MDGATVADSQIDIDTADFSYLNGVLTISRQGGANAVDQFVPMNSLKFSNQQSTTGMPTSGAVTYGGVHVADYSYATTYGSLTITFDVSAAQSTKAVVQNVLQNIGYSTSANTVGSIVIQATMSDGSPASAGTNYQGFGSAGNAGLTSNPVTVTVSAVAGNSTSFTEPNNENPGDSAAAAATALTAEQTAAAPLNASYLVDSGLGTFSGTATFQITGNYKSAEDVLTYSGSVAGVTLTPWDATTGKLVLTGTSVSYANWQTAMRAVSYYDTSDVPDYQDVRTIATTLAVTSGAGNGQTLVSATSMTVNRTDDLPWLANQTLQMSAVTSDGAPSNGSLPGSAVKLSTLIDLSSLGASIITDADGDGTGTQSPGIAITAIGTSTSTQGTWYYSTDVGSGTHWTAFPTLAAGQALNLALDSKTYVYFQPVSAAIYGTINNALTFRAWDQSAITGANVTNGTVQTIGTSGFGTGTSNALQQSYSTQADTVNLLVETPPTVTANHSITYTEPNLTVTGSSAAANAVAADGSVTVTNFDYGEAGATLSSATVQITGNHQSGDVLTFTNTSKISGSWNRSTGTIR